MKKIILLISIFLLSLPLSVNAKSQFNSFDNSNKEKVVRAFISLDGDFHEISLDQYNHITQSSLVENTQKERMQINHSESSTSSEISPMALTTYKYEESGFIRNFPRADMVRRISPIVYNETSQNASRTISYSASQGFVSNISLTLGGKKSAITAGITGGASWSNSYSQSDSVTQTIPVNKYAWMEYYPNHGQLIWYTNRINNL